MSDWIAIVILGAGTVLIRVSMLVFVPHGALPRTLREALRFVTPAILAAIIAPAVLYAGGGGGRFDASWGNERLVAAAVAVGVAWATKNVWLTIGVGMAVLWGLQGL